MKKQVMHQSRHEGTILKDKFTSEDIFERIIQVAGEEVHTGARELFFSALAAGFSITLTFILYANLFAKTGGHPILSGLLYPLGFVFIVMGNYQLFTENTLPPVALVLERLASIPQLFWVWGIVLAGNLVGGLIGAFLLAKTGVFSTAAATAATTLATNVLGASFWELFFRGLFAGLIVAGVVWLDYAMRDGAARFLLIYLSFLAIPLAGLNHVVITATEAFYLFFSQGTSLVLTGGTMILPVLLGNTIGGVLLVTIVNYFQTPHFIQEDSEQRLKWSAWLFRRTTYKEK